MAHEPDKKMGEQTRELVAYFLQELSKITGIRGQEDLVLAALVGLCAFSKSSGHDVPTIVRRLLETLSRREGQTPSLEGRASMSTINPKGHHRGHEGRPCPVTLGSGPYGADGVCGCMGLQSAAGGDALEACVPRGRPERVARDLLAHLVEQNRKSQRPLAPAPSPWPQDPERAALRLLCMGVLAAGLRRSGHEPYAVVVERTAVEALKASTAGAPPGFAREVLSAVARFLRERFGPRAEQLLALRMKGAPGLLQAAPGDAS